MNPFIYFIIGILMIELILPVIEALTIVIVTGLEVIKGRLSLTISKYNIQIQKMTENETKTTTHPIGFVLENITEEEEDD